MFLIALILRLFLLFFQYSGDIGNHLAWADGFLNQGTFGFFQRPIVGFNLPNYPPIAIYLFVIARLLYHFFSQLSLILNEVIPLFPSLLVPFFETQNAQAGFMKLPAIAADLGIGYLLYRLTKSKLLTFIFLFNPAVVYTSAVWGQIESIPLFFLLLSYYFATKKNSKDNLLSHVSFLLASLSKQTALWLLPLYLILWSRSGIKAFTAGLLTQLILFILIYLPFINHLFAPFSLYLNTLSGSSDLIADAAWNFWSFFYPSFTSDSILLGPLSVRVWSLFILFISYFYISLLYYQKRLDFFTSAFYLSLAAFFLQTRVHERHLFPALVFLLLSSFKLKNRLVVYLLISLYHMFNLYASLTLPFI